MKTCNTCGAEKPLDAFYRDNRSPNGGRIPKCKSCMSAYYKARYPDIKDIVAARGKRRYVESPEKYAAYQAEYREKNKARIAARMAAYHKSVRGGDVRRNAVDKSRKKHPERANARNAVAYAIASGALVRQPCERCGRANTHGHHEDYAARLSVTWLCAKCHAERHREMRGGK